MTQEQILNSRMTKSAKMRLLFDLGLNRNQVSELLNVGYGFAFNVHKKWKEARANTGIALSLSNFNFNHTFGVEIEAFGITRQELETELNNAGIQTRVESWNRNTRGHWKVITDASIRGEQGFEIVSPKLQGEDGLRQLKTVLLITRGLEAKTNKSCGIHIHFDASEFNLTTWKNLYKNYANLENYIDAFMPQSRRQSNNQYCRTMRQSNYKTKIDNARNLQQIESEITSRGRYYKLNTQSFWRQNSVEFRHHAGSTNFTKISNWIKFLARLVEVSKITEIENDTNENLRRFLDNDLINYFNTRRQELAA
jgi:hypothetical protein